MDEKKLTNGYLVFSNGTKLGVVEGPTLLPADVEFTPEPSERAEDIKTCLCPTKEATIETDLIVNTFTLWYLLTGMKITNNYLKMHGGVIQRHRQIRKLNKRKTKIPVFKEENYV